MIKKHSIFKYILLFSIISLSPPAKAITAFKFLSAEISQYASDSLNTYNTAMQLGVGFGLGFEKGSIELNPLIIIDGTTPKSYQGQAALYSLKGYSVGIEYNSIQNKIMTIGGGIYYQNFIESFGAIQSKESLSEYSVNTINLSAQIKFYLKGLRPLIRIQSGDAIHGHSIFLGVNLIDI